MILKNKNNLMLITAIFLCTWGVYSSNTDKAPLVLQLTNLFATNPTNYYEYFYLQEPKMKDDQVKYDHDIWYTDKSGTLVIMLSTLKNEGETKKWVMTQKVRDMRRTNLEYIYSRYDPPGNTAAPLFPTEKNDSETWKHENTGDRDHYTVKTHIPAISKIKSSEEIQKHLDFIATGEETIRGNGNEYVKTKLQAARDMKFQSVCRKYSTINILLQMTPTKEKFDKEVLELKKTFLYTNEETPLPPLCQQEVDRITKTFETRIYWQTGISVVLIILIISVLRCICSNQAEAAEDMVIEEYDMYDEENPAPRLRVSSNSEENPISSVISTTGTTASEENVDHHPTTDSVQSEKQVSKDMVTRQETEPDALFSSEEIFDTNTNDQSDTLRSAEETSVEKINAETLSFTSVVTEEKTQ